jgi:hypothetical protein
MGACEFPELAWLEKKFDIEAAALKEIEAIHASYIMRCDQLCQQAMTVNHELKDMLDHSESLTTQIEAKLVEANQLRFECRKGLLQYFFEVSSYMTPKNRRDYLAWAHQQVFFSDDATRHHGELTGHH